MTKYGVYLDVWGNFYLTDRVTGRCDFEEIDLTAGYKLQINQLRSRFGFIDYIYPNLAQAKNREVFAIIDDHTPILTPRIDGYNPPAPGERQRAHVRYD